MMLSINPIKSVSHARNYFMGRDNYYFAEGNERSLWWGKGADSLGLEGVVREEMFENILQGRLPNGQQLGKKEEGEIKHRPGFDLTFSVPKSVSLVLLMTKDETVRESIIQSLFSSVKKTMGIIERSAAQARVTKNGETYYVNTGNLVVALHLHELSRENEPAAHIHAVVMNMTQRQDGQWRSLASWAGEYGEKAVAEINGFFERVGHHKKQFGAIFRAELAFELKQKNFPLVVTDRKQGFFEIEGISQETREAYSTRAEQKNTYMEENGLSGAKLAALATLKTRRSKTIVSPDVLREQWERQGKEKGVNAFKEVDDVVQKMKEDKATVSKPLQPCLREAKEALQYALDYLSENNLKIKSIHLINCALRHALGEAVDLASITQAIDELRASGELIPIAQEKGELFYTTKTILNDEQAIIQSLEGKVQEKMKMKQAKIDAFLKEKYNLTKEQKIAIHEIFSSDYRITALDGRSQTGKTSLIKPMVELAKLNGHTSVVLTPNKSGSSLLKNEIQKAPFSIQQFFKTLLDRNQYTSVSAFIYQEMKQLDAGTKLPKNRMIFVDNAQLLSLKQIASLVVIAEKTHARLVPIGDQKSILSYAAGNPFQQMIDHGMKKAVLETLHHSGQEIIRDTVKETLAGNIKNAFQKMENHIFSIEKKEDRNKVLASLYATTKEEERKKTLVLMPSKAQCDEVNLAIREALKKEQKITSIATVVSVLLPKTMKIAEFRLAQNYQAGQWVRFNETYASLKVKKGDYLKIVAVNKQLNVLTLENLKKKMVRWDPFKVAGSSTKVEVFEEKTREVAQGDLLIWRRNHSQYKIASGEIFTVTSVSPDKLTLKRENHKKVAVYLKNLQDRHFDYGYALTPYSAHDKKSHTVIAYQNAYSRQSHQRLFYKIVSQSTKAAFLFTENKHALLNNIGRYTGDKITAIDTLLIEEKSLSNTVSSPPEPMQLLEKTIAQAIRKLDERAVPINKTPETLSKEAVNYALAHLAEREAAFQHKDVMDVALKYALGDANSKHVQEAIILAEKKGELVRGIYSLDGTHWTTQDAIKIEREIILLAKTDQGKMSPLVEKEKLEAYLDTVKPKKDHAIAIREWLSAEDRVVLVQGNAGTGKTTMLKYAEPLLKMQEPLLKEQGFTLLCLAPTHTAVKELKARDLTAQTLDSFLNKQCFLRTQGQDAIRKFNDKLIIAVDENSMTSNRRERDFLSIIKEIEARAILIGDKKQFSSIESGKPHALLQLSSVGLKTIYLTEIVRQKNPVLLKAVEETYSEEFKKAFETIKDYIVEIGQDAEKKDKQEERLQKIGEDYLSKSPLERAKTVVITPGNAERVYLNGLIRERLKTQGEIDGDSISAEVFVPRNMTLVEQSKAENFNLRDIIRFGYSDPEYAIHRGDYLSVSQIHKKENLITLVKEKTSECIIWRPKQFEQNNRGGVEVYQVEEREIMSGDLIRWTRSNKELDLLNPELAKVVGVDKNKAMLNHVRITEKEIMQESQCFEMNLRDPQYKHWDYAHVMTSYGVQGKSIANVLCNMESYSRYLTNQAAFLINLTRSVDNLTLYTNDKEALLSKIIQTPGTKQSALETIGEVIFVPKVEQKTLKKILTTQESRHLLATDNFIKQYVDRQIIPCQPSNKKIDDVVKSYCDELQINNTISSNFRKLINKDSRDKEQVKTINKIKEIDREI